MRIGKNKGAAALLLTVLLAASGCANRQVSGTDAQSKPTASEVSSDGSETEQQTKGPAGDESQSGLDPTKAAETEETEPVEPGPGTAVETAGDGGEWELPEDVELQQRIVLATDLHYLAEDLAGKRCQTFMAMVESSDGRVLQYSWEVLDAFIDDMIEEKPDLIVLSGDLTLNGERASHEELAEKLEVLLDNGIPVVVIPGNHDINNPYARQYNSDGTEAVDSITAEEFASIYADFGYVAADSRDPNSLSYVYRLDDYYWLMLLDSCQYEPYNQVGGMIRNETYDWMEEWLDKAWNKGAQVITVSHHNLLDQSGVSRDFYDNCTIEHNEELIRRLSDGEVRLHLSGHLHLQHHMQDEDSGIYEVVTGSLVMAPCQYGDIKILNDGTIRYDAKSVDVDGWALRNSYRNRDLADFKEYSENFLRQVTYRNALLDLRKHTLERKFFFSDEKMDEMAKFYAELCVHYYGGRMYQIADEVVNNKAYEYWGQIGYVSDLSDFLQNILDDDAKDFAHLEIPY